MSLKNNVTRLLDGKKVPYTSFEIPAAKLSALEVADLLGKPTKNVFKTIVLKAEKNRKPILAVVPATGEVNPKKLAAFLKEKKVSVTTQQEAKKLTGLLAGGISPLALIHKGFQVVVDASALTGEKVVLSGGQRGLQIELKAEDLIRLTNARTADITNLI
jgi:Cys-tRNA(Pro)/Cys-tRNA(Cys) deacylase